MVELSGCFRIFKNIFTTVCTALTLLLIFQELYSFAVLKPTSISSEEKVLQASDLPEVVICADPGLDPKSIEKYGYDRDKYYRGSIDGDKFIGWKGTQNKKEVTDILEELLIMKSTNLIKTNPELGFTENHVSFTEPDISLRTLVYPYGRCISLREGFKNPSGHDPLPPFPFFKVFYEMPFGGTHLICYLEGWVTEEGGTEKCSSYFR